ncbi:hypothetical protein Gpo141_00008894 [Globisporangium polare]
MVNYQARMQHLPRYPIGTRVSKYFPGYKEPFAGVVDDYSTYSHFYHITYEDGDSEEMTEEDLRIHVIHVATAPPARAAPEPVSKKPVRLTLNDKAPGEDVNKLVGLGISKLFVGDDGRETIVSGTVSAYFIATRKYRVLFFNGVCEDLSYQDVIESIPLSSPSDEESKKRKLADGVNGAAVPSASPKKQKVFESSNGGTAAESEKKKKKSKGTDSEGDSESVSELSPPFDSTQGLTKAFAHNITRSVLYVVVSASPEATGDDRKGLQLELLANGNLKPKKALAQFVEEGGLATLESLLSKWSESTETEHGMLVILKILAVLPGVTPGAVLSSQIGKMVARIWKQAVSWGFDDSISELAGWVVKKWKSDFDFKSSKKAASRDGKESSTSKVSTSGDKDAKKEKQREKSESTTQKASSAQSKDGRNGADGVQKKRSNSVNHLRDLMGSRGGKRDVLGSALGGKKRLGPAYAHRARRSTVVIDAVAKRFTENETIAEVAAEKATAEEEEIERETTIRFAESTVLEFLMDVEVSRLLTWGPTGRRAAPVVKPAPSLSSKPPKSILRVRLEPVQTQVHPKLDDLVAPPTVQTVSVPGQSSRHLDLSSSQSSFSGIVAKQSVSDSEGSSWSGGRKSPLPEGETSPPVVLQFAKRTEQTNRSPPPDFDERLSLDEGSMLSSSSPMEFQEIEDDDDDDANDDGKHCADEKPQEQPVPMPPALLMEEDGPSLGGSLSLARRMEHDAAIVVESVSACSE